MVDPSEARVHRKRHLVVVGVVFDVQHVDEADVLVAELEPRLVGRLEFDGDLEEVAGRPDVHVLVERGRGLADLEGRTVLDARVRDHDVELVLALVGPSRSSRLMRFATISPSSLNASESATFSVM
ncbi:hypothetical protein D8S78_10565 [Natrialba swarupiae]|nr:hypothetical protein [Natrialba swarupiae]